MDKWMTQIDELKGAGSSWMGSPEDQRKIVELLKGIGADPVLERDETAYLLEKVKALLGCPKNVSGGLVKAAAPPPPLPEGLVEASERPVDLQAAELLYKEHCQLIAERSWALFRYAEDQGFWGIWPDTPAKKAAQQVLQRLSIQGEKGWACPYGSANQVKSTVDQLKVLTSGGPLSGTQQPAVIVFRNGTFNLKTHQLGPHSPDYGATYGLAADYIANAGCPLELEVVLNRCYPPGAEAIVRAIIRWAVDPTIRYGEAFHIIGDTGTGKGLLIDFIRSLFLPSVIGQLLHPADLSSPEKVHQYVVGRRLVAFPDTPATYDGSCNIFYELAENKPVTTRKLFAGESEESRPLHCRFILGSVKPLQFRDGRDGYLRRVITLHTLPRDGEPDTSLRDALSPSGARFDATRAEAISWALAMSVDEVNAILNRNDPEGLLKDAAQQAAVNSDTVSQWADACLVPAHDPDHPLREDDRAEMFECYMAWCTYNNVTYTSQRSNFIGQLRAILGPRRCLPRTKESNTAARAAGRQPSERQNLPAVDAGFKLRDGILSQGTYSLSHATRHDFRPDKLGSGGLEEIAELHPAKRIDADSGLSQSNDSRQSQGPVSGPAYGPDRLHGKESAPRGDLVSGHIDLMPQELVEEQHDLFLSSPSTRGRGQSVVRRPETAETPLGAEFEVGAAVELIQPDGQWQNGWKVADLVPTKIGTRYRIESGGDYRVVGADQIRLCQDVA